MKNPQREKQAENALWTVIGYMPQIRKGHHTVQVWRALNMITGTMGPSRATYEEAEKDFQSPHAESWGV